MARTSLFLLVEFDGRGLTFADFTREHPGVTVDMLSEPVVEEGGERWHPSLVLVKGASAQDLDGLLARVGKVYEPPETLQRDSRTRTWVGRLSLRESAM